MHRAVSSQRMSRICPACEYDLTGLPEPCTCPECGREIEAGLRSIRVWLKSDRPSWILVIGFGLPSLFILGALILSALRQDIFTVGAIVTAGMGFMFLSVAIREVHKKVLQMRGTTTTLLNTSPDGVTTSGGQTVHKIDWGVVQRIRCTRSSWRNDWLLYVEGKRLGLISSHATFISVVLPAGKRTAAHVRNTLRRHHKAWQAVHKSSRKSHACPRKTSRPRKSRRSA